MTYRFPRFEPFMNFVHERHLIYLRRVDGVSPPWTQDPILAQYRFCNVYREYDRVTRWITEHWREPFKTDPHLWFLLVIARLVNFPETLGDMDFSMGIRGIIWDREHFLQVMHERKACGLQVYNGAYIVSTNGRSTNKASYLANDVLTPMWMKRDDLRPRKSDTLASYFNRLVQFQGMGSFMTAQIIADLKYVEPLQSARDWWTFASSGPGSRKGMSYLMGHSPQMLWREHEWRDALRELQTMVDPETKKRGMERIHAQDLQNCLCEYSKYRRTELGTGRPKSKFTPTVESHG